MKLPERLREFVHGPTIQVLGIRDAALQPDWAFVIGSRVDPDRESVTMYVLQCHSEWILKNLVHNGQVALNISAFGHETYQIKGDYVSSRPSDENDYAIQDIFWDKLFHSVEAVLDPTGHLRTRFGLMRRRPTVAIAFQVREVFDQNPGPGSGRRLEVPAEE